MPRDRRQQRRSQLRDSCMAVIEESLAQGLRYDEISVERLVDAVGISRTTFYAYFADKTDVVRSAVLELADAFAGLVHDLRLLGHDAERDQLNRLIKQLVDGYRTTRVSLGALYDAAASDAAVRAAIAAAVAEAADQLRLGLQERQVAGVADPDIAAAETCAWLSWMVERTLYQMVRDADDAETGHVAETLTDIIWLSIFAAPTAARDAA
jgi:AcrR family transcriptional regulator